MLRNRWGFDAVGRGEVGVTARWHYDKAFKRRTNVLGSAFMSSGKAKVRVAAAAAAPGGGGGEALSFLAFQVLNRWQNSGLRQCYQESQPSNIERPPVTAVG